MSRMRVSEGTSTMVFWEKLLIFLLLYQFLWFALLHGIMEEDWNSLFDRVIRCSILLVWFRVGLGKIGKEQWFCGFSHPLGVLMISIGLWKVMGVLWSISPWVVIENALTHFWLSCFVLVWLDVIRVSGVKYVLRSAWPLVLLLGVGYGFYQWGWVFEEMREEVSRMEPWSNSVLYQRWLIRVNSEEVFGTRFYPNLFGLFCGLGVLSMFMVHRLRVHYIVLGGLCMVGVILSSSKSAILMSSMLLIALLIFRYLNPKMRRVIGLIFILNCCLLGWMMWPILEASVSIRLGYWKASWNVLLDHPFGVGVGVFNQWYSRAMGPDATQVSLPHNDHLQVLVEQGWLGGLLHLGFWGTLVMLFFKGKGDNILKEDKRYLKLVRWAFLALLFYLCIFALFLGLGPMDLPVGGAVFLLTIGVMGIFGILNAEWEPGESRFDALLVLFLMVACVDFPMEDDILMGMVILMALSRISFEPLGYDKKLRFKYGWILALPLLLMAFYMVWLHQERVIVKEEIATIELEELNGFKVSDWGGLNGLSHWKDLYRRLSKEERLDQEMSELERKSLEQLVKQLPGKAIYWEKLGNFVEEIDRKEEVWLKAASLAPRQPRHAFHLGELYLSMKNRGSAEKWFKRALERHRYAEKRLKTIPDMELHLLQIAQVQKAETFVIP